MPCCTPLSKLTVACSLFSFFSSGVIQFGLMTCTLTTVQEYFALSYTAIAAAIISFEITQFLCSPIIPQLEQRWSSISAEFLCGCGLLLSVVGTFFYGLSQHLAMLVIGQLLSGIGGGSVYVLMPSMFGRLADHPSRISLSLSQSYASAPLGIAVAAVSCSVAVEYWRWLYVGFGCCLFIPSALFFYISYTYKKHDPRHKMTPPPTFAEIRKAVFSYASTTLAFVGFTGVAFVVTGISTFLPTYIEKHLGESKQTASLVLAGTVPAVCIGSLVGGKVSQARKWTHRKLYFFNAAACAGAFIVCLIWLPGDIRTLGAVVVLLVIAMLILFLHAGPSVAVVAQMLPRHCVTHGQSMLNMLSRACGSFIAPFVVAAMLDAGVPFNLCFFAASWVVFLAAVLYAIGGWVCPAVVVVDHDSEEKEGEPPQQSPSEIPRHPPRDPEDEGVAAVSADVEMTPAEPGEAYRCSDDDEQQKQLEDVCESSDVKRDSRFPSQTMATEADV